MAQDIMLHVKNITAGYGKLQILNGMTLQVRRGSITAILGGNGCGKSTTLKAIKGKDVFPSMTVEENLLLGAYSIKSRQVIRDNIEMVLESMPRLKDRFKSPSGVLSGGEQQMLSIGRGLMSNPKLLILDEPSAALSPKIADEIYAYTQNIHRSGVTILLVEQNVRAALRISEYAYILSEGHVIFEDKTENLRKHPDIKSFYLGNLPTK